MACCTINDEADSGQSDDKTYSFTLNSIERLSRTLFAILNLGNDTILSKDALPV